MPAKQSKPSAKRPHRSKKKTAKPAKRRSGLLFVLLFAAAGAALLFITQAAAQVHEIVSVQSGKCLDVYARQTAAGSNVVISDCTGAANQQWEIYGDGTIRSVQSGRCLDVYNQDTASGTNVQIWDCNGGANQQWQLYGNRTIKSVQSGKCLDVYGQQTANGANVQIWDCNGGANQQWNVQELSPPPPPPSQPPPPTASPPPSSSPVSPPQNTVPRPGIPPPPPRASNPPLQGNGTNTNRPIAIPQAGPDTTPPTTPANFTAQANELGSNIALSWQAATDNAGSVTYWLEKSANQQDWQVLFEDRSDTFYSDTEVKFETRYYYRLRARDAAGNYSGYATAEALTGSFKGNASPDEESVIKDEQKGIEVTIPAGALVAAAACTIEDAGLHVTDFVPKDYMVAAGPFQVLCKTADNAVIGAFNKPLIIKWTIQPPKNVAGPLEYYGYDAEPFKVGTTSRDTEAQTDTFSLEKGTTFVAIGKLKRVSIWVKIAGVLLVLAALAGAVLWFLFWRFRRHQLKRYNDYKHKILGG